MTASSERELVRKERRRKKKKKKTSLGCATNHGD
jgi:hypothetical protein